MASSEEEAVVAEDFNLEEFIKNATWKELLIHLVETNKLDPWNINISEIVEKYTDTIKKIKMLNLIIPANMVLAASVLLRIKSDTISIADTSVEEVSNPEEDESGSIYVERPNLEPLVFKIRPAPSRKITLEELMQALDQSIKKEIKREETLKESNIVLEFKVDRSDIDKKIDSAYQLIKGNADSYGVAMFSNLSRNFEDKSTILLDLFVPMLFLAKYRRVSISQEEFFGDIMIKLNESKTDGD